MKIYSTSKYLFFISILGIALSSCSYYKLYATPVGVIQLPDDNRIWYEDGAYEKARVISSNLDELIDKVEKTHYQPFKQPVKIYVFKNQESFEKYATVGKAGGETHGEKILISPKKANTNKRLPGIVLHELSHFHLFGYLGLYKSRITPRWFIEGLAVWVSDGAGAEKVSRTDANNEILVGNKLNPVTRHPIFFGEKSQPSGMHPHMFYRQSALFVEYLHNLSSDRFKVLLQGIEHGDSFDNTFEKAYQKKPNQVWSQFVNTLKHNQAFNVELGDAVHPLGQLMRR